jgi:hypothetical protein
MMVLGWTIEFYDAAPGSDCKSSDVHIQASIGIFTSQTDSGSGKKAMLPTGDVVITMMSPPMVNGSAAATMGGEGVSGIAGIVSITEFHLDPKGNPDRISGTVNAGGMDKSGNPVPVTGMFVAPVCD